MLKGILHVDINALVHIVSKQSANSLSVVEFIRSLVKMTLEHNIQFKAEHISGKSMIVISDAISRKQWDVLCIVVPQAELHPQSIPVQFQTMLSEVISIN